MNDKIYHKSVMVKEVLEYLKPSDGGIYVDATFGSGGHTQAILEANPNCKVIAIDIDQNAINLNATALKEKYNDRLHVIWGNFINITKFLKSMSINKIDGILADFGTSQYQIKHKPGFSFNIESILDMRMSPGHSKVTAYDIVNKSQELELTDIFYKFGQEFNAKKIAKAIVKYRKEVGPIKTTSQLVNIIESVTTKNRPGCIHPATKVFQALRIVANNELNSIKSLLAQSVKLLKSNGAIVCISFHSLEDTIVKQFFKDNIQDFKILTEKIVTATKQEIEENRSSRSAKLRAALRK